MSPKQIFLVVSMLVIFMGSSIGYVWSNFERTQLGYGLSQLKREEMKLRETNRKLRLELAILKSPRNLEAERRVTHMLRTSATIETTLANTKNRHDALGDL